MKFVFVIAFIALVQPIPGLIQSRQEIDDIVTAAKKDCIEEAPVSPQALYTFVATSITGERNYEKNLSKYAHCMNVRLGFQYPNGTFNPDVMKSTSRLLVDGSHQYDNLIDTCVAEVSDKSPHPEIQYLGCALSKMPLDTFLSICHTYYQTPITV